MNRGVPKGVGVALITPFHNDGSIDFNGLERLLEHCIKGGVDYFRSQWNHGRKSNLE